MHLNIQAKGLRKFAPPLLSLATIIALTGCATPRPAVEGASETVSRGFDGTAKRYGDGIKVAKGETIDSAFQRLGKNDGLSYILLGGGDVKLPANSPTIYNLTELTSFLSAYGFEVYMSIQDGPYVRVKVAGAPIAQPAMAVLDTASRISLAETAREGKWEVRKEMRASGALKDWARNSRGGWRVLWLAKADPEMRATTFEDETFEEAVVSFMRTLEKTGHVFHVQFVVGAEKVLRVLDPISR